MKYYKPNAIGCNWVYKLDATGKIISSTLKPGFWFDDIDDLRNYLRTEHNFYRFSILDGCVYHGIALIGFIQNSPDT